MRSFILKNTTSVTLLPPSIEFSDLRISGGIITEKAKTLSPLPGEKVIDLKGKIVMPGLVNSHTHLYSSLSRGMPGPAKRPRNFTEILKYIWWKLDRALDEEAIYYSTLAGAIEAARYGTTTLFDHHASPNCIAGSLDIIKEAMGKVGLRGVLCYEVTDRGGKNRCREGLNENERFINSTRTSSQFKGMVGAHASFTLSDTTLQCCGEISAQYNAGVHIHVAEAVDDNISTRLKYKRGIVDRFFDYNISGENSIFAHIVHLSPAELKRVQAAKTWLVHNPRSNINNQVGYAPVQLFGNRTALGTDGFPSDMFAEAAIGFYKTKDAATLVDGALPVQFLNSGQQLASQIFQNNFGTITKGAVADLIIMDYRPPTPIIKENIVSHFLFGMNASMVESVLVGGDWVVKNRNIVAVDEGKILEKAAQVAKNIWERTKKIV